MTPSKEEQEKLALQFAEKLKELEVTLPNVTVTEIAESLGILKRELTSVQTVLSVGITIDITKGGNGMRGMQHLFLVGLKLGMLYGMKVQGENEAQKADL